MYRIHKGKTTWELADGGSFYGSKDEGKNSPKAVGEAMPLEIVKARGENTKVY